MLPEVREIKRSEILFLREILYLSIYVPPGNAKLPKDIINQPELSGYIDDFGSEGDYCLVAVVNDQLIGGIWSRLFTKENKGYGFIDPKIPEMGMAVIEEYRNKGIGTLLLNKMIYQLKKQKFPGISLSVDRQNYAYGFYKKHGFKDHARSDKSVTMLIRF